MKKLIMFLFLCFSLQSVFAQPTKTTDPPKRTVRDDIPDDNPWKGLLEMIGEEEEVPKDQELSGEELEKYSTKILEKVNLLTNCISIVADKDRKEDQRTANINTACKLFLNEKKIVEVSNLKKGSNTLAIRKYLLRLKGANAFKVKIEFYEVANIGPLKKGNDGRYYTTAQIFQAYTSLDKEGKVLYSDKTVKSIEIICEMVEQKVGDQIEKMLSVMLGNITVNETKANN